MHTSFGISPPAGRHTPIDLLMSREKMFNERNIITERIQYNRHFFNIATLPLPKLVLHGHCGKNGIPLPTYECTRTDRQFYSTVTIQDKQYASVIWHRNARYAQQAAALVCCTHLGLYKKDFLLSIGCLHAR